MSAVRARHRPSQKNEPDPGSFSFDLGDDAVRQALRSYEAAPPPPGAGPPWRGPRGFASEVSVVMDTKTESFVRVERVDGGIAILSLDRPEKRNALSLAVMRELTRQFVAIGADASVRVV